MARPVLTPLEMLEEAAPTNPAAGSVRVYAGTDHALHVLTSGGVNTTLGAASKNYAVRTYARVSFR